MATMNIPDAAGTPTAVEKPNPNGQQAMAASRPVAIASDQSAVPMSVASLPLPTGAATAANQTSELTLVGAVTETAPATDTASSGLNGRLQRIAQRLTSLIALLPTALGAGGGLKVDGSGTALPVSAASLPLPTGAATSANQSTVLTNIGAPADAAAGSDTASSGVIGLLKRIAQNLTSLASAVTSGTVGIGTAGTPHANVLTVQGITSMTPLSVTPGALVAGTAVIGKVGIDQTTDGTTNKVNIDASLKSGTATRSSVNSGTTSVTILASNANRKGATIVNTDANALMLDLSGGTAAATRYQVKLLTDQTHEVAAGYTGAITGIWAVDGSGIADVVEFT